MKSVMILGGGIMQLPAIKIAKEMGWFVIVADGNDQAPGRDLADIFEHVDLKDKEGMEIAARRYHESSGLDGIFTAGTDFSTTVAWVADSLNLPGIPYDAAVMASRKGVMRRALANAGVPVPLFLELDKSETPVRALEKIAFPIVVKPVDNMGARGIRRVENRQELEEAFILAGEYSGSGRVILEEFIPGPEFSLDALVEDGEITICGFADRHIFFPPYFIEMGHTMPTTLKEQSFNEVIEVFNAGIDALGITRGAAKGDIKLSPEGPVVGEIAARLSGGFMSGWTFPYSSGVEVTRGGLRLAVGLSAGDLNPVRNEYSAERAFISIPGLVEEITGFESGSKVENVEFSFLNTSPGKRAVFPRNNVEKCGNYISRAETRDKAVRAAEEAGRIVQVVLTPGNDETLEFLLGESFDWIPGAHTSLKEADALEAELLGMNLVSEQFLKEGFPEGAGTEILIAPLKKLPDDISVDWHGLTFSQALERSLRAGGTISPGDQWLIGSIFWRALLRGGYQGGVWIIRTLKNLSTEVEREEFIKRWRG